MIYFKIVNMKLIDIITSIAMAKFFIGDKLFKKTINNSRDNIMKLIDEKVCKKSEIDKINLKKDIFPKNNTNQFLLIKSFAYYYDILFIDRKKRDSSVFIIEALEDGNKTVLVYCKDLQINKKMEQYFIFAYRWGLIAFFVEIGIFFKNLFDNNQYEVSYKDFEMSLSYLMIILFWGLLIKLYIEIYVSNKIKQFMHQFEELILK